MSVQTDTSITSAQINSIASELRNLIPGGRSVGLTVYPHGLDIAVHGCATYGEGTEILRSLGIGKRGKSVFSDNEPWCSLSGAIDNITFSIYCKGLPPTCQVVKKIERIPRSKVVETDEFIEVERTEIKCGELEEVEV